LPKPPLPKPPLSLLPKPLLLPLPKPLLLPLPNKPLPPLPLKPLLPKPVSWERKPLELDLLQRALWPTLRPLLKLLRQWVDPALVLLKFNDQCIQPCKTLALRRVVLPESLKPLVARR
jgi:hypothetical protein